MTSVSYGDLAQAQLLRRSSRVTEGRLTQLADELASGRRQDLARATGGDFKLLAGIERSLGLLRSFSDTAGEAALVGQAMQGALETIQRLAEDNGIAFTSAASNGGAVAVRMTAASARLQLDAAVSALNANAGDRYLFSGADTDRPALSGGEAILSALAAVTSGLPSAEAVLDAVRGWFDAPHGGGGFLDLAYDGSDGAAGPMPIATSESARFDVSAADPVLRRTLEGLALGALIDAGTLSGDDVACAQVLSVAGEALMGAATGVVELRGRIGAIEATIEGARVRHAAETSALEIAREGIVAADPYETASGLEETRNQLEMLYALTARLSHLSLMEYLR